MSDCAGMHSMLFCKYWREIPTFPQEHTLGKRLGETLYLNLLPNYDILGTLKLNVICFLLEVLGVLKWIILQKVPFYILIV